MSRLSFAVLLLVATPLLGVSGVRSPVRVKMTSSSRWDGRCPHQFHFEGSITSRGAGDIQYTWDRSDGSNAPAETLHFTAPNQTRTVRTSWTMAKNYNGWEQIRVTSPNFIRSNKAAFTLRCR
jgi:uncharacterized protein YndB with AHSA1/START domain